MKKRISIFFIIYLLTACSSKQYNSLEINQQSTLHPIPKNKTMLGVKTSNLIIIKINGEEAGDKWNGFGGDEQVNSGETSIQVRYEKDGFFATTILKFQTVKRKKYDIKGVIIDDEIEFTVTVDHQ